MKKNILWHVLMGIILFLQLVAETLTATILLRLNMLPEKFTVILILAFVLIGGLTACLMYLRFKKPVGQIRRIIAAVLALLIVCGCALVSKLAADAYQALSEVTTPTLTTSVRDMYVFVRLDDPAKTLADTKDYTYCHVKDYDMEHTEQVIALVEEQINQTITPVQHPTVTMVVDDLLGKQVDAAILNGTTVSLLIEQEGYENFMDQARILHVFAMTELEGTEPTQETTEPKEEVNVTAEPFVIYISGSDTRSSKLSVSRSDVNILVVVNPDTHQVLLLNTPRDYYIPNPAGKGKLDKLTHCGNFGVDCSIEALSDLYDLEVDYYAQINFTGFETLINAVGGITVYSDQAFTARDTRIKKGENRLNGAQALDFARERYNVSGGDNGRGKNQMKVIEALIDKMTSGTTVISNYSDILSSLKGMFNTSMTPEKISELVKFQLDDMPKWDIRSFAVTGTGGKEETYSWPGAVAYVMYPNEASVEHASKLVKRVLAGEVLTDAAMDAANQLLSQKQ